MPELVLKSKEIEVLSVSIEMSENDFATIESEITNANEYY